MYNRFFSFREKPFQLVPNPDFLFLGETHEEALAHLNYAVSQGDGFVAITGEVGTGKTTLCRVFLEGLDPDIEAAFIFNSKVNAVQLLGMIHRELGISQGAGDAAQLTHGLNQFLLEKKAQGTSVVILIDEAQNLEMETLEQLRMLSNLETTRSKLIQIILVGQPELRDILDAHELRQLRQRINVSCYLRSLTPAETAAYITHRIHAASTRPRHLFSPSAHALIHRASRGIPRLINIICDRALLAAYGMGKKQVGARQVRTALSELELGGRAVGGGFPWRGIVLPGGMVAIVFILLLIGYGLGPLGGKGWMGRLIHRGDAVSSPVSMDVHAALSEILASSDREGVFLNMAALWGEVPPLSPSIGAIESNAHYFKIASARGDFQLFAADPDPNRALAFNLPVIFEFHLPGKEKSGVLGVLGVDSGDHWLVCGGPEGRQYAIPMGELSPFLTGKMYIVWKDELGGDAVIAPGASEASIIALKLTLRDMGFPIPDLSPVYDESVFQVIESVQRKYGLMDDGLAGPETKIALLQGKRDIPRLIGDLPPLN